MGLSELLKSHPRALEYYDRLHPSVQRAVDSRSKDIILEEDLISIANNAKTESLRAFGGIFDDSETWPD